MIDVQRLDVLRAVATAGSLAGAAASLGRTPSAVSQQISALERGVRLPLLARSTRGVTLTDAGRTLLATADAVHAELGAADRALARMRSDGATSITVATFATAGRVLVAPALVDLATTHPAAQVTVAEAEPDEALASVRSGAADLALVFHFHTRRPPPGWRGAGGRGRYVPLLEERLCVLLPDSDLRAHAASISLRSLAEDRWIHGWGSTGEALDALAAAAGFRPSVACRASDYGFMAALVGSGLGVALAPRLALPPPDGIRAVPLTPAAYRYVGAFLPQRAAGTAAVDELTASMRRHARVVADLA